jgi:hypothetical protein
MLRWSPVYVPEIKTGRHVKNNACNCEIKIKWMIRKHMTYENTYRDEYIRCGDTVQYSKVSLSAVSVSDE